jgi:hypothetical protein
MLGNVASSVILQADYKSATETVLASLSIPLIPCSAAGALMLHRSIKLAILLLACSVSWGNAADPPPLVFRDVGEAMRVLPSAAGIAGHAAAWGDANGDGWPELFVGTFFESGSKANMLLIAEEGKRYRLAEQAALQVEGRASGSVFADLDNDGDLDLYLANLGGGEKGASATDSKIYRNEGHGRFADISADSGACPRGFRGRSVAVLDFDGDARLDLLLGESVHYGSPRRSRLLRNAGGLKFEDVSDAAGLLAGIPGLGVAAGDVNGDGWPDIFLASSEGGNRLLLNDGRGKFQPLPGDEATFAWKFTSPDDATCGVCFGDVNRDGLVDIVVGQHFKRPWLEPVAVRLYLNRGLRNGHPQFEDVTEQAGLSALPMKGPHVEIQDFDNDGWPDIYVSIVKFGADGAPHPLIFRNQGEIAQTAVGEVPQFRQTALGVNDFPTAEDRQITRTGEFFDKMIRERKIIYMAPGPTADFDRDGRLDVFLPNWWIESPSLLLRNETAAGNWLTVTVDGGKRTNRMGVGCRVLVYEAGQLGKANALLGASEISVGYGYCSGQEAIAHFGLGAREKCDLVIALPHGLGRVEQRDVRANQRWKAKL